MSLEENFEEPLVGYDWDAIIQCAKEREKKEKKRDVERGGELVENN
jgi:hypothetical protein